MKDAGENATVKVATHTYVIPDFNVGLVPNVGIIVGRRATLVIDPGLGRRNGETVLREVARVGKNTELGRSVDDTAATVQKELQAMHPAWARANGVAGAARAAYAEVP